MGSGRPIRFNPTSNIQWRKGLPVGNRYSLGIWLILVHTFIIHNILSLLSAEDVVSVDWIYSG